MVPAPIFASGADDGVADIAQMIGLGAGFDRGLLDLDEIADASAVAEPRSRPQPGKRSDRDAFADMSAGEV